MTRSDPCEPKFSLYNFPKLSLCKEKEMASWLKCKINSEVLYKACSCNFTLTVFIFCLCAKWGWVESQRKYFWSGQWSTMELARYLGAVRVMLSVVSSQLQVGVEAEVVYLWLLWGPRLTSVVGVRGQRLDLLWLLSKVFSRNLLPFVTWGADHAELGVVEVKVRHMHALTHTTVERALSYESVNG